MGIFDFFFGGGRRISKFKLQRLLRQISMLSPSEREYVEGVFSRYAAGNISKFEVEKVIRQLKFDTSDEISPEEAEAIRRKLLANL